VEAINPMDEKNVEDLRQNLAELKAMDSKGSAQGLQATPYAMDQPEGSKGAGLGFIEMARKADRFEFDFVGSTELLFVFKVWIKDASS
jgi:hypothetical protein